MPVNPQPTGNPTHQFSGPRYPNPTTQFSPRDYDQFPDPSLVASLRDLQGATAASCSYDPPVSAVEICPAEKRRTVTLQLHPYLYNELNRLIDLMDAGPWSVEELTELLLWNWAERPTFALLPMLQLRSYNPADHGEE